MTTLAFTLGEEDLQRIASAVATQLQLRPERRWFDVDAASTYTSLSKEAIRTAAKRGRLRSHKGESGRLVFKVEDLDVYLSNPE